MLQAGRKNNEKTAHGMVVNWQHIHLSDRFALEQVIAMHDLEILIKPISIRSIMKEMDNSPFPPTKPEKVQYMWRDIERQPAAIYGLPVPKVPAPYPLEHFDLANMFGVVMAEKPPYGDYLHETYISWFCDGHEAGGAENLSFCCRKLQLNYEAVLAAARKPRSTPCL